MEENEIKTTLKKLSEEIELAREEARKKGFAFTSRTVEQLEKKLRSVNTPFIIWIGWRDQGQITDIFSHDINVFNPDPYDHYFIFIFIFTYIQYQYIV